MGRGRHPSGTWASREVSIQTAAILTFNDLRSAYASATIYNTLSYGGRPDDNLMIIRTKGVAKIAADISNKRDVTKKGFFKIEIANVAKRAIVWFRRCLEL